MIKIMVVDDERDVEPLFRQKFRKEMREGKIDFHFAFSGEEALEYMRTVSAADIVLILSDINMPGITGIELLKIIKEEYSHLKVFMITAYDDKEKYEKSFQYGAEEYLTKPIDFEKLKKEIFSIIK
jgi:CheY-like chemotaxis protein